MTKSELASLEGAQLNEAVAVARGWSFLPETDYLGAWWRRESVWLKDVPDFLTWPAAGEVLDDFLSLPDREADCGRPILGLPWECELRVRTGEWPKYKATGPTAPVAIWRAWLMWFHKAK